MKKQKKKIIGYRVLEDCTLDFTNFDEDQEIIISQQENRNDWKGTDFFDKHPYEFAPIFES